jgi:hypothetical protein
VDREIRAVRGLSSANRLWARPEFTASCRSPHLRAPWYVARERNPWSMLIREEHRNVVRGKASRLHLPCYLLVLSYNFEVIVDRAITRNCPRFMRDNGFFFPGLHGTAQCDGAARTDDFNVMRHHRQLIIFDDRPTYLAGKFYVAFGARLLARGHRSRCAISDDHARVIAGKGFESCAFATVPTPNSANTVLAVMQLFSAHLLLPV